jgi:hypothetical protein
MIRMRHVHAHAAQLMVRKVQQSDFVLLLSYLYAELNTQCERSWFRPTLVVGIGYDAAA